MENTSSFDHGECSLSAAWQGPGAGYSCLFSLTGGPVGVAGEEIGFSGLSENEMWEMVGYLQRYGQYRRITRDELLRLLRHEAN